MKEDLIAKKAEIERLNRVVVEEKEKAAFELAVYKKEAAGKLDEERIRYQAIIKNL